MCVCVGRGGGLHRYTMTPPQLHSDPIPYLTENIFIQGNMRPGIVVAFKNWVGNPLWLNAETDTGNTEFYEDADKETGSNAD